MEATDPQKLGTRGETLAARFLKRRGMKILARNYRCTTGEIDLIALDPAARSTHGVETLVFVEVKTRTSDDYTDPQSAVNYAKQTRIRKAAKHYLDRHDTTDLATRYDIVAVVLRPGAKPEITYIEEAFH